MEISKKKILKTALLPEVLPRLNNLFGSGFSFLPYLLAIVYQTVKILPANHPYTKPENKGKYNLREVIAAAGSEIKFTRHNIDQIIIFFGVIAALFILLIQFILLIVAFLIPGAKASGMPDKIEDFFITPNPEQDIAFRMLDLVFGVPDFFGSKEATNTALHQALHSLFEFYSFSMLIVGSMIILYFAVAVVSETATSGVPFGKRFNKSWAPIRLILFFGLLIPISHGLNAGQYITLASAKLGSGLASQSWLKFNQTIEDQSGLLTGEVSENMARPQASNLMHIPAFMMIAKTCEVAYTRSYNDSFPDRWDPEGDETGVKAWAVYLARDASIAESEGDGTYVSELVAGQSFQDLTSKSGGNDIEITFGVKSEESYQADRGYVNPVCGTVILRATDVSELGSAKIHQAYFNLVMSAWTGSANSSLTGELATKSGELNSELGDFAENYTKRYLNIEPVDSNAPIPKQEYKDKWEKFLDDMMNQEDTGIIALAMKAQIEDAQGWTMPQDMKDFGWGGAGIWYNTIAEKNGSLISAIRLTPATVLYPRVLEKIKEVNFEENLTPNTVNIFTPPTTSGAGTIAYDIEREREIANPLNHAYRFWEYDPSGLDDDFTGNPLIDTINAVLGTQGLFEICKNTDTHPLAQLAAVGKSMLDNSIRSVAIAGGFGIASIFPSHFSPSFTAAASFYGSIAGVGILIGFMLFYVVPFMPFLYFFFAVGGWVKGIFEAMVAMPLWALAHLRIDGDGIPGEAAISGYYLIFEIFIRPVLIVFGLIAAVSIFAAMVKVLNETFYLAISNLSGHDPKAATACFQAAETSNNLGNPASPDLKTAYRGPIDEFFFTILYTIIVYITGTSCFKLIDSIPNQILRWINAEVPTFNDSRDDPSEGLLTYIALGGSQFGSQISGSLGSLRGGVQQSVNSFFNRGSN